MLRNVIVSGLRDDPESRVETLPLDLIGIKYLHKEESQVLA